MTDRILLIARHAEAQDSHKLGDKFRSLSKHGKMQAMGNGLKLEQLNAVPEVIVHSDATRIQETANEMISVWSQEPDKISDPRIYQVPYGLTGDNLSSFFGRILSQADDSKHCVMLLGHEPDVGDYARFMSGGLPASMKGAYPTATISVFHTTAESWGLVDRENCNLKSVILNGQNVVKPDPQKPSAPNAPAVK